MKTPRIFDLREAIDTEGRNYRHVAYIAPKKDEFTVRKGKIWNTYSLTAKGAKKFGVSANYSTLEPLTEEEVEKLIEQKETEIAELKQRKTQIETDAREFAESAVEAMGLSSTCTFTRERLYKVFEQVYIQVAQYAVENY